MMPTPAAATSAAPITAITFRLTPPRNRMPIAITAITISAPMSGSRIRRMPIGSTARIMGRMALTNFSFTSILRTM